MEWEERLNDAISYIEEHLTDTIDYGQLGTYCLLFLLSFSKNVYVYGEHPFV